MVQPFFFLLIIENHIVICDIQILIINANNTTKNEQVQYNKVYNSVEIRYYHIINIINVNIL